MKFSAAVPLLPTVTNRVAVGTPTSAFPKGSVAVVGLTSDCVPMPASTMVDGLPLALCTTATFVAPVGPATVGVKRTRSRQLLPADRSCVPLLHVLELSRAKGPRGKPIEVNVSGPVAPAALLIVTSRVGESTLMRPLKSLIVDGEAW